MREPTATIHGDLSEAQSGVQIGNSYGTILTWKYVASDGRSPFAKWFGGLDPIAAAKVTIAVTRLGLGNLSNVKEVGSEVFECRLAFGPGYRIYFGKDGDTLIILLGGGTKKRQHEDIQLAKSRWQEFKMRKTGQR